MQGRGACRTGLETTDLYKKEKNDNLCQGWGTLILEGHSPAEFSSNPE